VAREHVGEDVGVVEGQGGEEPLVGELVGELGVLLEDAEHLLHVRVDLGGAAREGPRLDGLDRHFLVAAGGREGADQPAGDSFDHDLDVAVRQLQGLDDDGNDADVVDVAGGGLVDFRVALRRQEDPLVGREKGGLERRDGRRAAHDEGSHHPGEDDHVPERHERQAPRLGPLGRGRGRCHSGLPLGAGAGELWLRAEGGWPGDAGGKAVNRPS
jgi:hypothetical protein